MSYFHESTDHQPRNLPDAIGISEAFLEFQENLSLVAKVDRPVLIIGERGTGKELAASRLHFLSGRWEAPLVALNCAALSESVLESELFGHEKGAFTGASERRVGRFELAEGGTLFLDEVGLVSIPIQEKILRGGANPARHSPPRRICFQSIFDGMQRIRHPLMGAKHHCRAE